VPNSITKIDIEAMKPFAVVMAVPILTLSLLGCSGNTQQATEERSPETKPLAEKRSPETQPLTEENVLSRARSEITKLGVTLPDEDMMKALEKIGFKPIVTPFNDGWKVVYPLGHPWAISSIRLEMDSEGKVLKHQLQPGE